MPHGAGRPPRGGELVLQTTFEEWQAYVADGERTPVRALGCTECHMPVDGDGTEPVIDSAPGLLPKPERSTRDHTFVGVDYDLDPTRYQVEGAPADALERVLEERQALLGSAASLEVVDGGISGGVFTADVVVRNNLLGHDFPTGFAFARQFWLEVTAVTASGRPVCLLPVDGVGSPCGSGVVAQPADDLRQCDPLDVVEVAEVDPADVGNSDVRFAAAFPASDCDPWLANFQKILTDGDPDDDGVFVEVPYQSFLPDIVKVRTRVADQQAMTPLKTPGTDGSGDVADSTKTFTYQFDADGLPPDDPIVVTAKLRFRHLPPDFVRALEQVQRQVATPPAARIDAAQLLTNMVVTDVVTARGGQGPVLACPGPQNVPGASVLTCIRPRGAGDRAAAAAAPPAVAAGPAPRWPGGTAGPAWLVLAWGGATALALGRRRRRARRARRARVPGR